MKIRRIAIRHQLLLLGALATASIWAGAALQYLQLRTQTTHLAKVRHNLDDVDRYAAIVRFSAQERGLTNGVLARGESGTSADLAGVRSSLDESFSHLALPFSDGRLPVVPQRITVEREQVRRVRGQVDRKDAKGPEVFWFYSGLVEEANNISARRLAEGMVAIGLPYEHVNHLQSATEFLARMRGLVNGVLYAGAIDQEGFDAITKQLILYEHAINAYELSVPDASRVGLSALLDRPALRQAMDLTRRLLQSRSPATLGTDPTTWWSVATKAVDSIQQASLRESAAIAGQADQRIEELQQRLRLTVAALILLGIITFVLVLSTVARIVNGISQLLDGLAAVGAGRNFSTRIKSGQRDEFGTISTGINNLIKIAGSVVQEHEQVSVTDQLTKVMNRRGFDQQLAARTTAQRTHSNPLSLVMIDVDHFKSVNDTLGHPAGDAVLRGLGEILRASLRPDDVLARFGGEEFVALLPGCPLADGVQVAEKLRAAVEAHDFGIGRVITASFGVAQWDGAVTPVQFIGEADAALYAAKKSGRNKVMCGSESVPTNP